MQGYNNIKQQAKLTKVLQINKNGPGSLIGNTISHIYQITQDWSWYMGKRI